MKEITVSVEPYEFDGEHMFKATCAEFPDMAVFECCAEEARAQAVQLVKHFRRVFANRSAKDTTP